MISFVSQKREIGHPLSGLLVDQNGRLEVDRVVRQVQIQPPRAATGTLTGHHVLGQRPVPGRIGMQIDRMSLA